MNFIGREFELGLLDEIHQRQGAQFLILYGRRRIGKTRLITHWIERQDTHHLYWMASQTSAANQLRDFSQALFRFLNPGATIEPTFSYTSDYQSPLFSGYKQIITVDPPVHCQL